MNGLVMLGIWTLVAGAIALIVGWPTSVEWMNNNPGVAGWVQAVFSVVAIVAAGAATAWQAREARLNAQNERTLKKRVMLEALWVLFDALRREFTGVSSALIWPEASEHLTRKVATGEMFGQLEDSLRAIPIQDYPDVLSLRHVQALLELIPASRTAVKEFKNFRTPSEVVRDAKAEPPLEPALNTIRQILRLTRDSINGLANTR